MTTDLKPLMLRFYDEVFNQGNLQTLDELVHDDFVEHEEMPGLPSGKDSPRALVTMFRAAFPDLRVTVEDIMQEGDKVAARARMSGTHEAEFMGFPPTGSKFDVQLIDVIEFRGDKAIAHWGVTDSMAMMEQLGVMEPPSGG